MSEFHSNVQFEPVKTQKDPSDHHWFVVEGNIGSGKSSFYNS